MESRITGKLESEVSPTWLLRLGILNSFNNTRISHACMQSSVVIYNSLCNANKALFTNLRQNETKYRTQECESAGWRRNLLNQKDAMIG